MASGVASVVTCEQQYMLTAADDRKQQETAQLYHARRTQPFILTKM